ncbi:YlaF family protein [Neobacillus niacini]|uniref:YlaF family protein n=1 Tax=Neobacillus niacini TaxID=86668 RepID=UPI0007ABE9EA|nr:YlaF family protein [Neobacillus niacini]MEC1521004.1 YlaF family protein [Neobacillus niacini]
MKQIKWVFIVFAVLAAASIMGIGVAIGEKSILGVIGSILVLIVVMGFGFKTKAKYRANGQL